MSRKDYYLILGISRSDAPAAIRSAYRDLAHRYHPDRTGPEGTRHFQEINEAYEVLSDPEQRAVYDRETGGRPVQVKIEPTAGELRRSSGRTWPDRVASGQRGPIPEPMIPVHDDVSVLRDFGVTRPSEDALCDRLVRNFARYGLPKSGRVEPLTVELHVSPDRARRGGTVTLALPVFRPCPACKGTGSIWELGCLHCNGTGMLETEQPVRILLPPDARDRDLFQVPIRHHGIQNLVLNLLVRVERR
jgi:DnaJ-class molecular chaperone